MGCGSSKPEHDYDPADGDAKGGAPLGSPRSPSNSAGGNALRAPRPFVHARTSGAMLDRKEEGARTSSISGESRSDSDKESFTQIVRGQSAE